MNKYREMTKQILRTGASCNAVALSRGVSHHTVRRHRDIALAHGLTVADVEIMTDSQYAEMFYPGRKRPFKIHPIWIEEAEYRSKGYNLLECHQRYVDNVGEKNAIAYSTYCDGMREYDRSQVVIFRHNHVAGYAMQTDFAGYRPEGEEDKSKRKFQLFVAVLPASNKLFANVVRSQSTTDHIEAYIAAIEYFGGVTEVVIPDNLKAAILERPKGKPHVPNPQFLCLSDHYGFLIMPARVRKPQDKSAVENAVKLVQRIVRLRLNNQPLLKLSEINRIVAEVVEQLNDRKMKRGNESRNERFERIERAALKPLPAQRPQFLDPPVERRIQPDHHVAFDKANYSVPHRLTGKLVLIRASSAVVEIRYDGQIVAVHPRSYEAGAYVTVDLHRPDNHLAWLNRDFDNWRQNLGEDVGLLVDTTIDHARSKMRERERIIARYNRLTQLYGHDRFAKAVAFARSANALTFANVTNILRNGIDVQDVQPVRPAKPIEAKSNIRGANYFTRDFVAGDAA
jgi:transposase